MITSKNEYEESALLIQYLLVYLSIQIVNESSQKNLSEDDKLKIIENLKTILEFNKNLSKNENVTELFQKKFILFIHEHKLPDFTCYTNLIEKFKNESILSDFKTYFSLFDGEYEKFQKLKNQVNQNF